MDINMKEINDQKIPGDEEEIGEEILQKEENGTMEDRVKSKYPQVRKRAYDVILSSIKSKSLTFDLTNLACHKFLEDPSPTALESSLDLISEMVNVYAGNAVASAININEVIRLTIEKAYSCSKTICRTKSKELICQIVQKSHKDVMNVTKSILSSKNTKGIIFCEQILLYVISEFGASQINYDIILPTVIVLLGSSNHGVKSEACGIVKELYKWERDSIRASLNETHLKVFSKEFAKIDESGNIPVPKREVSKAPSKDILPKEEVLTIKIPSTNEISISIQKSLSNKPDIEEYSTTPAPIYNIIRPCNENISIKELFNDDWIERLLSKDTKWIAKRDMLEDFTRTISTNKIIDIENSHENIFSVLKSLIKMSNVNIVQSTLNAITALSPQIGMNNSEFSQYMKECFPLILEKFKEKKDKVNKDIIAALTALLKNNLTLDEIIPFLENLHSDKSIQFKLNVCEFLYITLRKTYLNILKRVGRELVDLFTRLSDEQNIEIRTCAFSCLALLKIRLKDLRNLFDEMGESSKLKIEEALKGISYEKLYDVEQIVESPSIKIQRKSNKKTFEDNTSTLSPAQALVSQFEENKKSEGSYNSVSITSAPLAQQEEAFYKKDQQSDLEDFERKLEEAMKKEEEKQHSQMITEANVLLTKGTNGTTAMKKSQANSNDHKEADEEVNNKINPLIGQETVSLLQSSKWEEKKQGFIQLNEWLRSQSSGSFNMDVFIAFTKIKLKEFKETNFNVIREACNVYLTCINNYSGKGFEKKHGGIIIRGLYEKLGDSKLKEVVWSLLYSLMENIGPKFVITSILSHLNNEKSKAPVNVLKEYSAFFEKVTEDFGIRMIPVKEMVDLCISMAGNVNPQVRSASISLLCAMYKYVGKDIKLLIKDIKESTLKIIETEFEKIQIVEVIPNPPKRELKETALKEEGILTSNKSSELIPRIDISKKITPKMLKEINDGKWPEKKEACEAIEKVLKDANMKILPNGLNDLFTTIKGRLSDGNKNLVRMIVSLLSKLIEALGIGYKPYCKALSAPLIANLADKMQMLREDVLICLDKWVAHVGLDMIIIYLPPYLKQDNFEIRTEILKFLSKNKESFANFKPIMESVLKEFITPFLICLQDKAASVRSSTEELIATSLKYISLNLYMNGLKDFKPAIANTLKQILEKFREESWNIDLNVSNNSTTLKSDKSNSDINSTLKKVDKSPVKREYEKEKEKEHHLLNKADSQKKIKIEKEKERERDHTPTNDRNANNTSASATIKVTKKQKVNSENNVTTFLKNQHPGSALSSKSNLKGGPGNSNSPSSPRVSKNSTSLCNMIFLQNITIRPPTKDKRLEIDRKYNFSLETINEDFSAKLKDQLRCVFTTEFMTKLFNEDFKCIIDVMTSFFTGIKEEENCPFMFNLMNENLDMILKWIGWKLNNNQNPLLIKVLIEFFEVLHEKFIEKELKLNDTEGYIILALLIDKLGATNVKVKDTIRILIDQYIQIISGNRAFHSILYTSASKNSKVKIECLDMCASLISNRGVDITSAKDLKYLAKYLTSNDSSIRNGAIQVFQEVYSQIRDNLWNILTDTPEKIKEMLYNKYNEELVNEENNDNEYEYEYEYQENEHPQITMTTTNDLIPLQKINDNMTNLEIDLKNPQIKPTDYLSLTTKSELLSILNQLNNSEMSEKVNTIILIHELISTKYEQSKNVLIANIDTIIISFISSLKKLFQSKTLQEIPIKLGKYLITVLCKISSIKDLIRNISYNVLYHLSEEVLSSLLIENLDKVGNSQEGAIVFKSLNSTMLRVLENCNSTDVILVLLELVDNYRTNETKNKLAGLAIKCLLKINQILGQIIDNIEVDRILFQVHTLLVNYDQLQPDLAINNQTDQMVVRYIKNLINELVKLKRESVIQDYIKGVESHQVKDKYIRRWIKNILSTMNNNTQGGLSSTLSTGMLRENSSGGIIESMSKVGNDKAVNKNTQILPNKEPERTLNKIASNPNAISSSPNKQPQQNEMYNKIINLKSKLASYHNNTNQKTVVNISEDKINKENESNCSQDAINKSLPSNVNDKSFMSTISELKKKWNDVSNKNKMNHNFPAEPSPILAQKRENNEPLSQLSRLNEMKNKLAKTKK